MTALHNRAPENSPSPPPFSKMENFQQPHLLGSGVYFALEATLFTMPKLGLHQRTFLRIWETCRSNLVTTSARGNVWQGEGVVLLPYVRHFQV